MMTEPDWKPVDVQPQGYITAEDAAQIRAGTIDVCAMSMQRGDVTDVAMFAAPVSQQPEQPAWKFVGVGGLKPYLTQRQYEAQAPNLRRWYVPIGATTEQPGQPQEYMRGYSDAKAWAAQLVRDEWERLHPFDPQRKTLFDLRMCFEGKA